MAGPSLPIYIPSHIDSQLRALLARLQQNVEVLVTDLGDLEDVFIIGSSAASEAVSAGEVLYATGNDTVGRALATTAARSRVIGIGLFNAGMGDSVIYQNSGLITTSGLTAGARYFLSADTPGALVTTPDATAGEYVVPVGYAVSTTKLLFLPFATTLL